MTRSRSAYQRPPGSVKVYTGTIPEDVGMPLYSDEWVDSMRAPGVCETVTDPAGKVLLIRGTVEQAVRDAVEHWYAILQEET